MAEIADELPDARKSIARALGRGCGWAVDEVITQLAFDGLTIVKAEAGGWQPIKTAPKDGTVIDLWVVFPAFDNDQEHQARYPDCHWDEEDWQTRQFPLCMYAAKPYATHWQPLPAPPSSLLNKEDRNG